MDYAKRLENFKQEMSKSAIYTAQNKKLILGFVETCKSKDLTNERIIFYLSRLKKICEFHKKDFKKWDKQDVEIVMRKVHEKDYKPWTIEAFKTTLKVFFRWLNGLDRTDPTPKLVSWLSRETPQNGLRKEDLLTREEIIKLGDATTNIEHKCLLAMLSAGPRPSEIFSIRLSDVRDEGDYMKTYVRGKMHKKMGERTIFIGFFIKGHQDFVRMWLKQHPNRDDKDSKLFPGLNNYSLNMRMRRLQKRAKIKKKIWAYLFRHTFGTWAYGNYEGAYARRLLGHAAGSKMEGVYCHLAETDLVERLLGKKPNEEKPPEIDKVETAREVLNVMATMPEFQELAARAVEIWKNNGSQG